MVEVLQKVSYILKILFWFLSKPKLYKHALYLGLKKFNNQANSNNNQVARDQAELWCKLKAIDRKKAILSITGLSEFEEFDVKFKDQILAGDQAMLRYTQKGRRAADIELLYTLSEYLQANTVIETGVAFGWSSLAILLSLHNRKNAKLYSTDMPYIDEKYDNYVGCVVPPELTTQWCLVKYPDRQGLPKILENVRVSDMCHYDSDKSYEGRFWAYPKLWNTLRIGGVLVSDDISDNLAFRDFCSVVRRDPIIIKFHNKYIGILIKE